MRSPQSVSTGRLSLGGGGTFNERKTLEDLLQVHDLSRNELPDGKSDDIDALVDISDDASNLRTGQAAGFGAQAEHNLVAVDGVDVEVDSGAGTAGAGEPIQDRGTRLPQLVRAERLKAPLGKVRIVVVGPRMEPHQGDSVRCDDRGKHRLHLRVAVPGERGDCHRVIAGVLTVAGTDIRVGVDPDDRKVVSVPVSERGERRDAHRALSTEGGDPAGLCWRMISSARASCSTTIALASTPSRSAKPSSVMVTGAVTVSPSCGGSTAARTAEPTAYPRRPTSNGNSEASCCTLTVPAPCHCGQTRRRFTSGGDWLE